MKTVILSPFTLILLTSLPFWGVNDVTKGVKIIKYGAADTIIGFLTPKNISIPIFRSKQSFNRLLLCFYWFLTIFGASDITKRVKIIKYGEADTIIGFLNSKNVSILNFRWKQSFTRLLLCFYWFFDHFGVQLCHKRGQDYKIWVMAPWTVFSP